MIGFVFSLLSSLPPTSIIFILLFEILFFKAVRRMESILRQRMSDGKCSLQEDAVKSTATAIGYGAVKYFDLRQHPRWFICDETLFYLTGYNEQTRQMPSHSCLWLSVILDIYGRLKIVVVDKWFIAFIS